MAKELICRDIGFDCKAVMRADTEAEVLKKATDHAKTVHHITALDDATMAKVRAAVHDAKK
jgi:predicted small metal-binding protein